MKRFAAFRNGIQGLQNPKNEGIKGLALPKLCSHPRGTPAQWVFCPGCFIAQSLAESGAGGRTRSPVPPHFLLSPAPPDHAGENHHPRPTAPCTEEVRVEHFSWMTDFCVWAPSTTTTLPLCRKCILQRATTLLYFIVGWGTYSLLP